MKFKQFDDYVKKVIMSCKTTDHVQTPVTWALLLKFRLNDRKLCKFPESYMVTEYGQRQREWIQRNAK